mmetsp:Transcript_19785/g.51406  ORF Transcript_19785/g.51406 Transcript_19785/m.51406 type:complete len:352 (-) Transcript_19785:20-1075(-)
MRRATSATLLLRLAAACDDAVTVPAAIDGNQLDLRFRRDESLLGQGLAYAMCHSLRTPKGCEGLCAAQALADRARAAFLASGCGAVSLDKRFDVLQVGAHVGNSRDDANRLLDPVFAWLRTAPAHASVLLVEPMRASFEALVSNVAGAAADVSYLHAALVPERRGPTHMFNAEPARGGTSADLSLIASLDPRHIEGHVAHNATGDARVRSVSRKAVAALDWAALAAAYALDRVGFLALDAEGIDCKLVLSFPFDVLRPNVVQFEHTHCDGPFSRDGDPADWVQLNLTRGLLGAHGYEIFEATEAGDVTFVRADSFPLVGREFAEGYKNRQCRQPWLEWGVRDGKYFRWMHK